MLRVEQFYSEANSEANSIIKFVYSLYEDSFGKDFSDQTTVVSHWKRDYALAAPKRLNPSFDVDNRVFITSESTDLCQIVFQLGHEFSHVAMGCYPNNPELKWISECLCEAASIHVLKKSIDFYSGYIPNVREYIDGILKKIPCFTEKEIQKYIMKNIKDLKADPIEEGKEGRPRNKIIGKHWSKIIEQYEDGWNAIGLFTEIDDENMDENEFLKQWYEKCRNEEERVFVRKIIDTIL